MDMVNTLPAAKELATNQWVEATWAEFLVASAHSETEKSRCYYDQGWMRIETMGVGSGHGQDNSLLAAVVSLYGTLQNIAYVSFTNSSFQKVGERECQPDLAYYLGESVRRPPKTSQPVDVGVWGAPTLAIEIAATSLSDDLGQKRLLYERLGVAEYWVVDVESMIVTAFAVQDGGSRQIQVSLVLPGLAIALVETALQRSQTEEDGAVNRWLMQEFMPLG
jgi:Uma2 family endonuclease